MCWLCVPLIAAKFRQCPVWIFQHCKFDAFFKDFFAPFVLALCQLKRLPVVALLCRFYTKYPLRELVLNFEPKHKICAV